LDLAVLRQNRNVVCILNQLKKPSKIAETDKYQL